MSQAPDELTPGVRRRSRQLKARRRRVSVKLSDAEYSAIVESASEAGLSVAAYMAQAAVRVARSAQPTAPADEGTAATLRELVEARRQVRRYGVLVNQGIAALNSTGEPPGALAAAVIACTGAVQRLDAATIELVRRS